MFQVASQIQSVRTLADNTIRLTIDAQEMPPEQMAILFKLKGQIGWTLFKENPFKIDDVPVEATPDHDKKSPSQRLRDRMFVFYQKKHGKNTGFNEWYADNLDAIGQKFLDKIEDV